MHRPVLPEAASILPEPVPLDRWHTDFPPGELRAVVLHWTAGDYCRTFGAYHWCIAGPPDFRVHATCDLRANMRDVRALPDEAYAAHAAGRNSFCAGVAACAMAGATPHDFGAFPLLREQTDALCRIAAALADFFGLPTDAVRTHAELAVEDGYFGAAGDDARWDLARLEPSAAPLAAADARKTGERLRARIAALR